jgi:hypothetical protein
MAVLGATKCDLEDERQVPKEEYEELGKKYGWPVVETSSLTYVNVEKCFDLLVRNHFQRLD